MPDYSNSKIYIIRFLEDDNHIYIGSTTQSLAVRFGGHKITVSILYKYIQDVYKGDWSKCYIKLYEEFKCENKEQLNKREGEIIRDFMKNNKYQVLNKRIEGRTQKEYKQDNKEKIKEYIQQYQQQYQQEYNEKVKERRRKFYEKSKINGTLKEYLEKNKDKIKEYRENNKDKAKEYYEKYKNAKASASAQDDYRKKQTERKRDYRQRLRIYEFLQFIKDL